MILFWITAAAMLLLALAFALTPLLRNKPAAGVNAADLNLSVIKQQLGELDADLANGNLAQTQYEAARRDLEKELVQDVTTTAGSGGTDARSGIWAVAVVAAGVPLLAVGMYQGLGQQEIIARLEAREGLQTVAATDNKPHADRSGKPLPPMDELVKGLAARLEQDPDNLGGWIMLARSYLALGQAEGALEAYNRAYRLAPEDPEVLLAYAQTLVKTGREELSGRPAELIATAYRKAPKDPTALWMMGLLSFERQEFDQTIRYWEELAAQLPQDSEQAQQLAAYIQQARSRAAPGSSETIVATQTPQDAAASRATSGPTPTTPQTAKAAASAGKALTVSVSLDPSLADKARPGDRVFVFARALSGPPMPLAAVSREVRDLPLQVTLDDSMAMMPQMKLSAFPEVLVGARVSKSGSAMPQSGDLQGEVSPVQPGQTGVVEVVINSLRP